MKFRKKKISANKKYYQNRRTIEKEQKERERKEARERKLIQKVEKKERKYKGNILGGLLLNFIKQLNLFFRKIVRL